MVVETQPDVPEDQSPSNVVTGVLSELVPQEEVAELESSNKGKSNDAPISSIKKNKGEDRPVDEPIDHPPVHIGEETVQAISLSLKDRPKGPCAFVPDPSYHKEYTWIIISALQSIRDQAVPPVNWDLSQFKDHPFFEDIPKFPRSRVFLRSRICCRRRYLQKVCVRLGSRQEAQS